MADITQNSFLQSNNFDKVIYQRGRDVRDSELNEMQDILRVFLLTTMYAGTQEATTPLNPGSNDTGYQVVGTGASNAVTINSGTLICDGIPLVLTAPFTFSGFTTPGTPRTDVVYLAVTEVEVADPSASPQLGATTTRRQLVATLAVSTTGPSTGPGTGGVPSNTSNAIWQGGTHYYVLANIQRPASAVITAAEVTDERFLLPPSLIEQFTTQFNRSVTGVVVNTVTDIFGLNACRNWQPAFTGLNEAVDLVWNPAMRLWQYLYWDGTSNMSVTYYCGTDQQPIGTTETHTSITTLPYATMCTNSGVLQTIIAGSLYTLNPFSTIPGSWVGADTFFAGASASAMVALNTADWAAIVSGTGGVTALYFAGVGGAAHSFTFTLTGAVPSGGWTMSANGTPASPGTLALFIGKAAVNAGGLAGIAYVANFSSTIVSSTSLTGIFGATDVPIDIAYDSYNQRWIVAVSVGGTATTAYWATKDGVNFTKLSQIGSMVISIVTRSIGATQLRSIGSVLFCAAYDSVLGQIFLSYSLDGIVWKPTEVQFYSIPFFLHVSDTQLAYIAVTNTSNQIRFSAKDGLPTATDV